MKFSLFSRTWRPFGIAGGLLLLVCLTRPDAAGKSPLAGDKEPAAAALAPAKGAQSAARPVHGEGYLRSLAKETWDYLADHVDPVTGFPTDTQKAGGKTNTTNIGLYLASLGPAAEMGFVERADATLRARKVIEALSKQPHTHGFLQNWISVDGQTGAPPGFQMLSDFNKLVAGLIMVRQCFPELAPDVTPLIERIDWSWLYDGASGRGSYGWDLTTGQKTPPAEWWLAADIRLGSFFMVASEAAPPEFWDRLTRNRIEADGLTFFSPGYEVGGIFMQAMDGLFLDERGGEMGKSVGDFAWHQIRMARSKNLSVWGWSNCNVPGAGYTEGGFLPWWVVTPHASALAIEYYPKHVVENLKRLDAAGLRKPLEDGRAYGFRDSLDVRTGIGDQRYLCLDQAMIFLSLANYLEDGIVRRAFARDPLVAAGLSKLGKRLKPDPKLLQMFAERDRSEPKAAALPPQPAEIVVDLRAGGTPVELDNGSVGEGATVTAQRKPFGLMVDFNLGDGGAGESDVTISMPPVDMRQIDQVIVYASGMRLDGEKGPFGCRVYLRDDQGQGQFGFLPDFADGKLPLRLPDYARRGIFARPEAVSRITLKFWGKPWYFAAKKTGASKGQILVEKIIFKPKAAVSASPGSARMDQQGVLMAAGR